VLDVILYQSAAG
jgi:hypothetical protein